VAAIVDVTVANDVMDCIVLCVTDKVGRDDSVGVLSYEFTAVEEGESEVLILARLLFDEDGEDDADALNDTLLEETGDSEILFESTGDNVDETDPVLDTD
jgi:hypothetical protein